MNDQALKEFLWLMKDTVQPTICTGMDVTVFVTSNKNLSAIFPLGFRQHAHPFSLMNVHNMMFLILTSPVFVVWPLANMWCLQLGHWVGSSSQQNALLKLKNKSIICSSMQIHKSCDMLVT
jgi:hypothetical protein